MDVDKIITGNGSVPEEWIDYNGHLTEYRYGQIIADGGDSFLEQIGLDLEKFSHGGSYFTVESHILYKNEMKRGENYHVECLLLFYDEKRLHLYQKVVSEHGHITAIGEQLLLFVDNTTRSVTKAPDIILEVLKLRLHQGEWPKDAGKVGKK